MIIQQIARTTRIDEAELKRIAANASSRYKVYEIDKRNKSGKRVICHPSRELKALQRWISRVIISKFPVHYAATAYRVGGGIRENAERHRKSKYTNRYDFSNFFPSFTQGNVEKFVREELAKTGININDEDLKFIGNILCRRGRLTIGAPSSPAITNAMMFEFDRVIYNHCDKSGLIYTRYADDIYISSDAPDQLKNLEPKIAAAKRGVEHLTLRLNRKKTVYLSKKYARVITGVVVTSDHKLSIGRDRKKEIKSLIYKWKIGKLRADQIHYMRGLLAFARDIEPAFEYSCRKKYGSELIIEILKNPDLGKAPSEAYQDYILNLPPF